jgi:hypothetical protein
MLGCTDLTDPLDTLIRHALLTPWLYSITRLVYDKARFELSAGLTALPLKLADSDSVCNFPLCLGRMLTSHAIA